MYLFRYVFRTLGVMTHGAICSRGKRVEIWNTVGSSIIRNSFSSHDKGVRQSPRFLGRVGDSVNVVGNEVRRRIAGSFFPWRMVLGRSGTHLRTTVRMHVTIARTSVLYALFFACCLVWSFSPPIHSEGENNSVEPTCFR